MIVFRMTRREKDTVGQVLKVRSRDTSGRLSDGSPESPIIIDDPGPASDVDWLLPLKKRRSKNLKKQPQRSPKPTQSLRRHYPSVQQFGAYDDLLTDTILDKVSDDSITNWTNMSGGLHM